MYTKFAALSSVKRENQFMSYKSRGSTSTDDDLYSTHPEARHDRKIKPFKVLPRSHSTVGIERPQKINVVNSDLQTQTVKEDKRSELTQSTSGTCDHFIPEDTSTQCCNKNNLCVKAICCPAFMDLFSTEENTNYNSVLHRFSASGNVDLAAVEQASSSSTVPASNCQHPKCFSCFHRWRHPVIDTSMGAYYIWLIVISIAILYNMTLIIARSVFTQLATDYKTLWYTLDYTCDIIYVLDMLIEFNTGFLEDGLPVRSRKKLACNYVTSSKFLLDILSIVPTDLFYFVSDNNLSMVRINRLLRFHRLPEFFDRTIRRTRYPNVLRILNLVLYILIIVHWNACFYYAISKWIGFGTDRWVYPDGSNSTDFDLLSRKYIYSFYWSTLTLLTIGETPHPEKDIEYVFVVCDFLVGVLIFATIVGNVGSMVTNLNHDRGVFTQKLDGIKRFLGKQIPTLLLLLVVMTVQHYITWSKYNLYMKIRKVNKQLEKKVINWFDYLWTHRDSLDDEDCLMALPDKLRAEIVMHVHLKVLNRLSIFKNCEPGLLAELVLKLKLQVFSPGDYICKIGDIGREMYIIKQGMLSVRNDDGSELTRLRQGDVCGELSILEIPGSKGGNRRMADVISVGYAECLILSKSDLWGLLKDYPVARQKLYDRGRDMLNIAEELNAFDSCESIDQSEDISPLSATSPLVQCRVQSVENQVLRIEDRLDGFISTTTASLESLKKTIEHLEELLLENRRTSGSAEIADNEIISPGLPFIPDAAQMTRHRSNERERSNTSATTQTGKARRLQIGSDRPSADETEASVISNDRPGSRAILSNGRSRSRFSVVGADNVTKK